MSTTIKANLKRMFEHVEPCDCSGSQAELGPSAAQITWRNALRVAAEWKQWLRSPLIDACEGMREWARSTGAWDEEERNAWTIEECLALFVQNIASKMRTCLDADDLTIAESVRLCRETERKGGWQNAPEYPIGRYYSRGGQCFVDYYTGG